MKKRAVTSNARARRVEANRDGVTRPGNESSYRTPSSWNIEWRRSAAWPHRWNPVIPLAPEHHPVRMPSDAVLDELGFRLGCLRVLDRHRAFDLAQAKEYFLSVLGKKSRSRLKHARLVSGFSFQPNRCTDRIAIALIATKIKGDGWRQIFHHILQEPQLRSVAVFQEHFKASVVIEISQSERPSVLDKIQTHHAGNV